jgi:hypothetical protein
MLKFINTTNKKGNIKTLTMFDTDLISEKEMIARYDNTCFVSDVCCKTFQRSLDKEEKQQIDVLFDFTFSELNITNSSQIEKCKVYSLSVSNGIIELTLNKINFVSLINFLNKNDFEYEISKNLWFGQYISSYSVIINNVSNNISLISNRYNFITLKHK